MIKPHEFVMRHGEYDPKTKKLTEDGKKAIEASIWDLAVKLSDEPNLPLDIHASAARSTLATAAMVELELGHDTTTRIAALLNPELPEDPSRETLLQYLKLVKDVGGLAAKSSGLLIIGHMATVVNLANLEPDAAPDYGQIFPIEYPSDFGTVA